MKPVLIKLSPDLTEEELKDIVEVSKDNNISGYICTNLTKKPERIREKLKDGVVGKGGISGKPISELSNEMIRRVYKMTKGKAVIVGVGGLFTANDAYEKIKAGASLLELITGMVYEGPSVISSINMGLVDLLKKDGYNNISESVGVDNKPKN